MCCKLRRQLPAIRIDIAHITDPFADDHVAVTDQFHAIAAIGEGADGPEILYSAGVSPAIR